MTTTVFSLFSASAIADAVVTTRAMSASTIAEVFIEEGQVRTELEIGANDLSAFSGVLPDKAYEKLSGQSRPLAERIEEFLDNDWVIRTDEQALMGRISNIRVGRRVSRDEVSGDPLPVQPNDAEYVVRVTLLHRFEGRPSRVTIRAPMRDDEAVASVGFVCYHNGLPVNDFRYLPGEATVELDWDDPWYSRFRHRNLGRRFNAPLSAYLYVEPFEVRKEIIVRPKDLKAWIDLDLGDAGVILVAKQEALKQQVAEFLAERNPVTIDGRIAEGKLDRIHFVRRTLRTTGIVEPAVDMDAISATLGVIFVYPVDSLPKKVEMRWELFTPKIQAVPAVASDEAGGLPSRITPEAPVLEWTNYLTNPTSPELRAIESAPTRQQIELPLLSLLCGCVALGSAAVLLKQKSSGSSASRTALVTFLCGVLGGIVAYPTATVGLPSPISSAPRLSESEGRELLATLLYNVYRSFDGHDESLIYDRLSRSIAGDLLSEVYLETRKSMEVKNQGGLRVSVKQVDVTDLDFVESFEGGSTFACRWRVAGWIGHWGHIHRRENEHAARITIAPREQQWKITAMELLDEQSLEPSRPPKIEDGGGA